MWDKGSDERDKVVAIIVKKACACVECAEEIVDEIVALKDITKPLPTPKPSPGMKTTGIGG